MRTKPGETLVCQTARTSKGDKGSRGAAVRLRGDELWATPLAWPRKRGHGEIAGLLKANGAR